MANGLEQITDKIRKLMALANRAGTEAEAALAAARVAELCRKHNLELGAVTLEREEKTASEGRKGGSGRWEAHRSWLGYACNHLFDVAHYRQATVNRAAKIQNSWAIVFYGLKANVESATMTFSYLDASVEAMLTAAYKRGEVEGTRAACRAFRMGCASRINEKAREHARLQKTSIEGSTECQAIVLVGNQLIEAHAAKLHLGSKGPAPAPPADASAWAAGRRAGERVDIHGARNSRMLKGRS